MHLFDVHVGEVGEEVIADQEAEQHPVIYHTLQVVGELKPSLENREILKEGGRRREKEGEGGRRREGEGGREKEGEGGSKKCLLVVKI